MEFHIARNRVPRMARNPDMRVSSVFSKYEMENPDLPVEDILEITAKHFAIPTSQVIKKLWGTR